MKKVVSLILAVFLCLSATASTFADSADSAVIEQLIISAKEKLPIDDNKVTFRNYSTEESEAGTTLYHLNWRSEDEAAYQSIRVSLEADGTIRSYNRYENQPEDHPSFLKHKKTEALEAAKAFIERIDPARLAETGEPTIELDYNRNYTVTFPRIHNQIIVEGDFLCCTVQDADLEVTDYESPWRVQRFAEGTLLTDEAAQQAFCEQTGYQLYYQIYSHNYENMVKPVYRSRYDEAVVINALTGEAMLYPDAVAYRNNMKTEMAADTASGGGAVLSEVELALVGQVENMLSKAEADKLCRSMPELQLSTAYELEDYATYRSSTGVYVIQLQYQRPGNDDGTGYGYKSVSLEAEGGRMLAYYFHEQKNTVQPNQKELTADVLQAKAEQFLKTYYIDETAQMTKKTEFNHDADGRFDFVRLVSDIPVYQNGASLSFDEQTGELTSFFLSWTETDFPEVTTAAGIEQANATAMTEGRFSLRYAPAFREEESTVYAEPIYGLQQYPVLDAETLTPLDATLQPINDSTVPNYQDIDDFYGAAEIRRLLENDLYLPTADGLLHPRESITQEDYLRFTYRAIYGYEAGDSDSLYRTLIRRGVLTATERNPKGALTRYEAAAYLIRMLGYGEFVQIPDIFRCPFEDITPEQTGMAAVAWGLGLIRGDGSRFYPNEQLCRGDAMILLHNYLAD